ncbi:DUF924 domain-containing protein [Erythrobacter sp. LQ02-29]|uniref:DUF924 family protein n=1 Tax=Erythrobacter sp. LQ02-29 TaxID=2920384 RepID=UPI001F4DE1B9|nr:DUF924 family protein [Erythrobacter sp. LQ02-29]MCP9221635.1 DUF924 domain-containing protein [Erythrobacter sp. LQ02-29]
MALRADRRWAAELLQVWFHALEPADHFRQSDAVDAMLRRRFARDWAALYTQPAESFARSPGDALGAVLLFDQVPRNLFRDSATAFATDPLARAIAKTAMARGFDRAMEKAERQFLYMPLMHSEQIADQLLSLRLFTQLGRGFGMPFARSHYRMIARFGRFPHRNPVLGRQSTAAEKRAVAAGNDW